MAIPPNRLGESVVKRAVALSKIGFPRGKNGKRGTNDPYRYCQNCKVVKLTGVGLALGESYDQPFSERGICP